MQRCKSSYFYAALLDVTLVAYLPVWRNGFVDFDDEGYITSNPHVSQGLSWSNFCWAWTSLEETYWQPLSWLSLQTDVSLSSESPDTGDAILSAAVFHGQSLLWHAGSVLLLFGCLQRLIGSRWSCFFASALFALHPMHVESVAWAAERKDVLSVFFGILTLWAYARYVDRPGWQRYAIVMAAFTASLMSKPMLMTLPLVLLLLDYWPFRRFGTLADETESGRQAEPKITSWRWLLFEKLPLFLLAAAIGIVTAVARHYAGTPVPLSEISLAVRLANALSAYGHYLHSTIWPWDLAAFYQHPRENWSAAWVGAGAAALFILTLLSLMQRKQRPWLLTGWLWFVISLLPVIGLWQGGEQAWADRFSYWPHIGLFLVIVCGIAEIAQRWHLPSWSSALPAVVVLGCAAWLTWMQTTYWYDTLTLWNRVLAVSPDSSVAHLHLGRHWTQSGRLDRARHHYAEAVRLMPNMPDNHLFHGQVLLSLGRTEEAAAEFRFCIEGRGASADAWYSLGIARLRQGKAEWAERSMRKVLEIQPDLADAHTGLGLALLRQGKRRQSLHSLQEALARNPRDAEAWSGLAQVHLAQGKLKQAVNCFQRALEINPQAVKAVSGLGLALGRQGRWPEAAQHHRAAVQLGERGLQLLEEMGGSAPREDLAQWRCHLALALSQAGYTQLAAAEYRAACKIIPDWPSRLSSRAWTLATHPDNDFRDPQLAYELALETVQAVEVPSAAMLDVLAAAQAAHGDFQDAVRTARLALARLSLADGQDLGPALRGRLRLYESRKPFTTAR